MIIQRILFAFSVQDWLIKMSEDRKWGGNYARKNSSLPEDEKNLAFRSASAHARSSNFLRFLFKEKVCSLKKNLEVLSSSMFLCPIQKVGELAGKSLLCMSLSYEWNWLCRHEVGCSANDWHFRVSLTLTFNFLAILKVGLQFATTLSLLYDRGPVSTRRKVMESF